MSTTSAFLNRLSLRAPRVWVTNSGASRREVSSDIGAVLVCEQRSCYARCERCSRGFLTQPSKLLLVGPKSGLLVTLLIEVAA